MKNTANIELGNLGEELGSVSTSFCVTLCKLFKVSELQICEAQMSIQHKLYYTMQSQVIVVNCIRMSGINTFLESVIIK